MLNLQIIASLHSLTLTFMAESKSCDTSSGFMSWSNDLRVNSSCLRRLISVFECKVGSRCVRSAGSCLAFSRFLACTARCDVRFWFVVYVFPQSGSGHGYFLVASVWHFLTDPRSLGESDGQPRNEIDPSKQLSDYSDALSFLLARKTVDPERIAVWGMSFSATIALCAASLDKRARLCIAACPYLKLKPPPEKVPQVLAKCMEDRESRHLGNPPTYLPMLTATGRNPAGLHLHPKPKELELVHTAEGRGAANFENRSTLETYYRSLTWSPEDIMKYLSPTPVLFIVLEQDTWSPPEKQLALFGTLASPKRVRTVPGKGHLTLCNGEEFSDLMQLQGEFLKRGFEGKLV